MIGIYKITNLINGKIYIGQSVDINKRWRQHKRNSQIKGREYDKYLYRAFRKYGLENFSFELLLECSPQELNEKEKYFINLYSSDTLGYNSQKGNK